MQNISLPFGLFIAEGLLPMRQQLGKLSIYHVGLISGENSLNPVFSITEYISQLDDRKSKEQRCPLS